MLKKDCSLSFGHGPSTEKRRAVAPDRESGQPRQIGSFTLKYEGNRQPPHGSRVLIFEAVNSPDFARFRATITLVADSQKTKPDKM